MGTNSQLFAAEYSVPTWILLWSFVRTFLIHIVGSNNPLWWKRITGQNPQADVLGPLYVVGPPPRPDADGKVVMATFEEMKRNGVFLFLLKVIDATGKPLPHVFFDWWQADADGEYCLKTYGLRGTFRTDANGAAEILTVPPGKYGVRGVMRAGHFHVTMRAPGHAEMTTQVYLCRGNKPSDMSGDWLTNTLWRPAPASLMMHAWATQEDKPFLDLPPLSGDNAKIASRVDAWNEMLKDDGGADMKVVAGAEYTIVFGAKGKAL